MLVVSETSTGTTSCTTGACTKYNKVSIHTVHVPADIPGTYLAVCIAQCSISMELISNISGSMSSCQHLPQLEILLLFARNRLTLNFLCKIAIFLLSFLSVACNFMTVVVRTLGGVCVARLWPHINSRMVVLVSTHIVEGDACVAISLHCFSVYSPGPPLLVRKKDEI